MMTDVQEIPRPESAGKDRGLRDLFYYFPSKALPALFGAVQVLLLTRGLGPDGYGQAAIGIALANVLVSLSSDWLRQSILRFFPMYQASERLAEFRQKTWTLLSFVLCFILVIFFVLGSIVTGPISTTQEQKILVIVLSTTMVLFHYHATLLQSARQSRQYAIATFVQSFTQLALIMIFVLAMHGGVRMALLSIAGGYGAGLAFIMLTTAISGRRNRYPGLYIDIAMAKQMASYGLPMAIWFLSAQLIYLIPRYVIGSYWSFNEVGVFSSSYDLINGSMSLLMTPFLLASVPIIMNLWETGQRVGAIQDLVASNIRYISLLFAPLIALSMLSGQYAIGVFLGENFIVVPWFVPVLILSSFISGLSMYAHKGLEVGKRTHIMLMVALASLAVNGIVNLILVPLIGYPAAAISTVLSSSFYMVVTGWLGRKFLTLSIPWRSLSRIALACVSGALMGYFSMRFFNTNSTQAMIVHISGGVVALLVYGTLLLVQREIDEEIDLLRSAIQHFLAKAHQMRGL